MVRTIAQPLLVLDGDLTVLKANPAFHSCFQVPAAETINRRLYELGNGQWDIPALRSLLDELQTTRPVVEDFRVEHEFEGIGHRVMLVRGRRIDAAAHHPALILLAFTDITEQERVRFELEGQKEFTEKLIDSVREAILVLGWDLRVKMANQPFYDCFQVNPAETEGLLVYDLGNGQWNIPRLRELLEGILPQQMSFDDFEVEHTFEHLGPRTMLLNARRLDHLNLIVLAIRDITQQRRHEAQQSALMGELQHRVKNILASVRVLASFTAQSSRSLDEFGHAFDKRLQSLGRVQDLLVRSSGDRISLSELVDLELRSHGADTLDRVHAEGPLVELSEHGTQLLAMVLHELITNAAKHGALATDGTIEVAWQRRGSELRLTWRERGVTTVQTTKEMGFGSKVLKQFVPLALGGKASLVLHPDGAEYCLDVPTDSL